MVKPSLTVADNREHTISSMLEVHIGITKGSLGHHVTTHTDGEHGTCRTEFFKQHRLRDIWWKISDVERYHRVASSLRHRHLETPAVFFQPDIDLVSLHVGDRTLIHWKSGSPAFSSLFIYKCSALQKGHLNACLSTTQNSTVYSLHRFREYY